MEHTSLPQRTGHKALFVALLVALFLFLNGCSHRSSGGGAAAHMYGPPSRERSISQVNRSIIASAKELKGIRYKSGGDTPETGFDCSGYVCWVYGEQGISLPRTAREQSRVGRAVRKKDLQPGDIVAFRIRSRTGYHTGIYTGNGKFIHSPSSGKSVSEASMTDGYWGKRYIGARRVSSGK